MASKHAHEPGAAAHLDASGVKDVSAMQRNEHAVALGEIEVAKADGARVVELQ